MTPTLAPLAGVAAQFISSASNFVCLVLAARAGLPSEFGAVALAFAVYAIVVGLVRAALAEPLIIRYQRDELEFIARRASSAAFWLGILPGALLVAAQLTVFAPGT